MAEPHKWSSAELEEARAKAQAQFILERNGEGSAAFYEAWDAAEPRVWHLLSVTANLTHIPPDALVSDKPLWQSLRYACAPPISEEDLWTLVGKKFKNVPTDFAPQTASAFEAVLDLRRFPWVAESRVPSGDEISKAVAATTALMAHESFKTQRRGLSSRNQEAQVAAALLAAGVTFDSKRSPINSLDELARHSYARERKVAGAKCDVPIRLRDGRLLALECKVSNGPKNSWKRLQREVGGKADTWRRTHGSQVITGAMLAGVFDLSCVKRAQDDQGVAIFWQHDMQQLVDFVTA